MEYAICIGFRATTNEAKYKEHSLAFDFISDRSILLEFLPNPSIDIAKPVCQTTADPSWMDDIIAYIKDGIDNKQAPSTSGPILINQVLPHPRDFIQEVLLGTGDVSNLRKQIMYSERFMKASVKTTLGLGHLLER